MADWQDMSALEMDGRSVEFNASAAIFTAAALQSVVITPSQDAIKRKPFGMRPDTTLGLWPDITYNPTLWRELP